MPDVISTLLAPEISWSCDQQLRPYTTDIAHTTVVGMSEGKRPIVGHCHGLEYIEMDHKNRMGGSGLHGKDILKYLGQHDAGDFPNTDISAVASDKRSYPRWHVP
jgi:hypothetical protein